MESLKSFSKFENDSIPDNTLIRNKQGRAMLLGSSLPSGNPVHFAEGYRLLISNNPNNSTLSKILPDKFYSRCTGYNEI